MLCRFAAADVPIEELIVGPKTGKRKKSSEGRSVSRDDPEAEVVARLSVSGGRIEHAFLWRGRVRFWDPKAGKVTGRRDNDAHRKAACVAFLRAMKWECETKAEVNAHARRLGWANWPTKPSPA